MVKKKSRFLLLAVVLTAAAAITLGWFWWTKWSESSYELHRGVAAIEQAHLRRQNKIMVEVSGRVVRFLADGKGSNPQQRFVINLSNDHQLQVLHSLRHSERVPISISDEVTVRGEYRWTEPGGVILWTYWDHGARKRHGWIEHQGTRYD
jgi:hypothetical protein